MRLTRGVNHVAVLTDDLDRFVDFYTTVFDLELVFTETTPAFRHAILRTGPDSWLHPAEVNGHGAASASATMFERGHLDHLALTADSVAAFDELCGRLTAHGASDGTIEDLGSFHSLWFTDPDGMHGGHPHRGSAARRDPRADADRNVVSQWWGAVRPRVVTAVAPGRVHCGTGRLVGPQVGAPSASERQYQHASRPAGQPSGLSCHASRRP